MRNKLSRKFKYLLIVFLLLLGTVILLFLLKHAFFYSFLDEKQGLKSYPHFYSFLHNHFHGIIHFIGSNAIVFFYLVLIVFFAQFFFFFRHNIPIKKDFKIYFIVTLVFLIIAEFSLRLFGFTPGQFEKNKYFQTVDELWSYKSYAADRNGILKVDPSVSKTVAERIRKGNTNYGGREYGEVYCLGKEFVEFKKGQIDNEFYRFYKKTCLKKLKTDLDSAIVSYVENPINTDGFFSIPFKNYDRNKPVVLLLGDSFTWGHSAMPKTNSFAHLLLSKGYVVYNTGISATDVAQYLAVAKKYVSKLKPDYVIVNFFIGNDVNYYKRNVIPFKPVFYCTNAGNIYSSYDNSTFKNKEEAYNFALKQLQIPQEVCLFNKLMAKSAITSLTWGIMKKSNLFPYLNNKNNLKVDWKTIDKKPYCNEELAEIKKLCESNKAKFILSSIPEVMSFKIKSAKDVPYLFDGFQYFEMKVTDSDYNLDDGHFNVQGHRRYGLFLHRIIKSKTK